MRKICLICKKEKLDNKGKYCKPCSAEVTAENNRRYQRKPKSEKTVEL
jgi:hypothetical protein